MRRTPPPWSSLALTYVEQRDALTRALQSSYASTSFDLIEDAVNDAFLAVLQGERIDPVYWGHASKALLYRIAWRSLRGHLRRKANRVEQPMEVLPENPGHETAESAALAESLARVLDTAINNAARHACKRDPAPLAAALRDRVCSGETDGVVAARHGVRREMLNRARQEMLETVRAA